MSMPKAADTDAIAFAKRLSANLQTLQDRAKPPLSNRALAKKAGLAHTYVTTIHTAAREGIGRVPALDTLMALAVALGCELETLVSQDGPDRPSLHDIIVAATAAVDTVIDRLELDPTPQQRGTVVARLVIAMRTMDHLPADLGGYAETRADALLDYIQHAPS